MQEELQGRGVVRWVVLLPLRLVWMVIELVIGLMWLPVRWVMGDLWHDDEGFDTRGY